MAFINLQTPGSHPAIVIELGSIIFARTNNASSGSLVNGIYLRLKDQESILEVTYKTQAERDTMHDKLAAALV